MRLATLLTCAALTPWLASCVVEPRPAYYRPPPPPVAAEVYVPAAPPAPIYETPPPPPGPEINFFWQPGYWRWNGGTHVWVAGRWAPRPARFAGWEAPRWEHRPGGWFFIEGHFR